MDPRKQTCGILVLLLCDYISMQSCFISSPSKTSPLSEKARHVALHSQGADLASRFVPSSHEQIVSIDHIAPSENSRYAELMNCIEEIESLSQSGQQADVETLRTLVIACSDQARGDLDGFRSTLALQQSGHYPSSYYTNSRLRVCISYALGSPELDLALRALDIIRKSSSAPPCDIVENMLETIALISGSEGALAQGVGILTGMTQGRISPEPLLLEAMLEASIEMASAEGVLRQGMCILDIAFETGIVNAKMQNVLLKSLSSCSVRSLEYGLEVFSHLALCSEVSIMPPSALLSACALVAGGGGCLLQALHVLNSGTKHGLPYKEVAFGDVVQATTVAARRGLEIGLDVVKISVDGRPESLRDEGRHSCSLFIEACCNLALGKGALQLAIGLVQRMAESKLKLSAQIFSQLVETCAFCGDCSGALGISLAVIEKLFRVKESVSAHVGTVLLQTFARATHDAGSLHRGQQLLEVALTLRIALDRRTCNTLLTACARSAGASGRGVADLCWDVLELLDKSYLCLGADAYQSALETMMSGIGLGQGAGEGGLLGLGVKIMTATLNLGLQPSAAACNALLLACAHAVNKEQQTLVRGVELVTRLYETGLGAASGRLHATLLDACRTALEGRGALAHGVEVVEQLSRRGQGMLHSAACIEACHVLLKAAETAAGRGRYALVQGIRTLGVERKCGVGKCGAGERFLMAATSAAAEGHLRGAQRIQALLRASSPLAAVPSAWSCWSPGHSGLGTPPSGFLRELRTPPPDPVRVLGTPPPARPSPAAPHALDSRATAAAVPDAPRTPSPAPPSPRALGQGEASAQRGAKSEGAGVGGGDDEVATPQDRIVRTAPASERKLPATPTPALSANKMLSRIASPTRRHLSFGSDDDSDA